MYYSTIFMCIGSSCQSRKSIELKDYFKREIENKNLEEYVKIYPNGCLGTCQKGPSMFIIHETLGLIRYVRVDKKSVIDKIIEDTLIKGKIVDENYLIQHVREN